MNSIDEMQDGKSATGENGQLPFATLKKSMSNFELVEAFKILRTNIEFSKENMKVICVTSFLPNDGKSTVAFQLA